MVVYLLKKKKSQLPITLKCTCIFLFGNSQVQQKTISDSVDPLQCRNLESKGWLPPYHDLKSPLIALIREFYSNLSIQFDSSGSHILIAWIRGEEFNITKQIVSEVLGVPLVHRPTYPCSESPSIDDVITLLCGRFVTWGTKPRFNSYELIEYNYMFRMACHNLFPISHVHTIPIDRCVSVCSKY